MIETDTKTREKISLFANTVLCMYISNKLRMSTRFEFTCLMNWTTVNAWL